MKKISKILGLALLALMAVCLTSCGGDDDDDITDGAGTEINGGKNNTISKAVYSMEISFSSSLNQYEGGMGAFEVVGDKMEDCSLTSDGYTGGWTVLNSDDNGIGVDPGYKAKYYSPNDVVSDITVTTGPNAYWLMYENNFMPKTKSADKLTIHVKVKKNGKQIFEKEFNVENGHSANLMVYSFPMSQDCDYALFTQI